VVLTYQMHDSEDTERFLGVLGPDSHNEYVNIYIYIYI
jgi:hypothetical protein